MIQLPKVIFNHKLFYMYKLFILFIFLIVSNSRTFSQKVSIETVCTSSGYRLIFKCEDGTIDSLTNYGFKPIIYDKIIFSRDSFALIYETPYTIDYDKFVKTNNKWNLSKSSGNISGNPSRITSAPIPELIKESKKKREYKIIGDDLVSIKVDGVETIKDCNDFRIEREAREREYQEKIKNWEQEKK